MKLQFDSNLDYQTEAVNAVTNLFKGQSSNFSYFNIDGQTTFDYVYFNKDSKDFHKNNLKFGLGVGNKLLLGKDDILKNLRQVQSSQNLIESVSLDSLDFNIEMETGTGKTYVYLKTIFELNKLYGFTKFIVVVPSVAIREGVYKTLQITKNHFENEFDGLIYDYFIYDSLKIDQVRNFAMNSNIEIMIINIDSFNKSFDETSFDETQKLNKSNVIHRPNEKINGYKPIELIAETNPIVIIDEPQSVLGGNGEVAINYLNPLCTLRYSATHKEIQNLIYRLNAVDAYDLNLVKKIEVANLESEDYFNKPYVKLLSVNNKKKNITARLEINVNDAGIFKRKIVTVSQGDDLSEHKFSNMEIYENYRVNDIYTAKGDEYIEFTPVEKYLRIGESFGDFYNIEYKRAQIRKTIEEHLIKKLKLNKKGIKVLSLFFIDKVSNYKKYLDEQKYEKGIYAKIFEEEFKKLIKKPRYSELYANDDLETIAEQVHKGYFSKDKDGRFTEIERNNDGTYKLLNRDESTFNDIIKNKEFLLSFDSKLEFIFSHSALKEGWDNPNVFQICTLNETVSTIKKRQEIGRGLRLCVNQNGERINDTSINVLTIMANESYESFAKSLQSEIEEDTNVKFGIIEKNSFSDISMKNDEGLLEKIGYQKSLIIYNFFKSVGYIDRNGKIKDKFCFDFAENNVNIPEKFESIKKLIIDIVLQHKNRYKIQPSRSKKKININEEKFNSIEFNEFWEKIKHKTKYLINFDNNDLIDICIQSLEEELNISKPKLIYTKKGLAIDASGVNIDENGKIPPTTVYTEDEVQLPDILSILQRETSLTRDTIAEILINSNTLNQFKKNPEEYISSVVKIINRELNHLLIEEIKYVKLDECFPKDLFISNESYGYENKLESVNNSLFDGIVWESTIELNFIKGLENDPEVIMYTKLPRWFKIDTPIGGYTPDWAVLLNEDDTNKLYFIVETKGNVDLAHIFSSLSNSQIDRIKCGKKHFEALNSDVRFKLADDYDTFIKNIK